MERSADGIQKYLQPILSNWKKRPPTIKSLRSLVPPRYRHALEKKWGAALLANPEATWNELINEVIKIILRYAATYHNGVITIPALMVAQARLFPPMPIPAGAFARTYFISGSSGIDHGPLREILNAHGFRRVSLDAKEVHIGFVCLEQFKDPQGRMRYDYRAYRFRAWVKSIVGPSRHIVCDKGQLYEEMMFRYPELTQHYMPFTRRLSEMTVEAIGEKIWIIKPTTLPDRNVGEGFDISVVTGVSEIAAIGATLTQKYHSEPIISEYVPDPWLVDGKKCHLRMLLVIRTAGRSISGQQVPFAYWLWDQGVVATASAPYRLGDWDNREIHDSHGKSTDRDRRFDLVNPDVTDTGMTVEQRTHVYEQMVECVAGIGEIMRDYMLPYEDSSQAYETFGIDFLVRSDLRVVLLECNDHIGRQSIDSKKLAGYKPGGGPYTAEHTQFSRAFWEWAYDRVIGPYFE